MGISRYRQLSAEYAIRPRDVLLRLPNQTLYIGPRVSAFRVDFDVGWEECRARWTLGVRNVLEPGDALPLFVMAAADTLGESDLGAGGRAVEKALLESEPLGRHCWRCNIYPSGRGEHGCHVSRTNQDLPG